MSWARSSALAPILAAHCIGVSPIEANRCSSVISSWLKTRSPNMVVEKTFMVRFHTAGSSRKSASGLRLKEVGNCCWSVGGLTHNCARCATQNPRQATQIGKSRTMTLFFGSKRFVTIVKVISNKTELEHIQYAGSRDLQCSANAIFHSILNMLSDFQINRTMTIFSS